MNEATPKQAGLFLAYLADEDVCILNKNGVCIASSNQKKVGSFFDVSKEKLKKSYLNGDTEKIIILYDDKKYSAKELKFVKSLAKLTLYQYINSLSLPSNSVDQFIAEILEKPLSPDRVPILENNAQSLGLNLNLDRVAILIEIENFNETNLLQVINIDYSREEIIDDWKKKIASTISGFFTHNSNLIVAYLGKDYFICFKEVSGDHNKFVRLMKSAHYSIFGPLISSLNDNNLTISFSVPHHGLIGLYDAYQESIQASQIGKRLNPGKNRIYYYGDLGTLRIITEKDVQKKKNAAKEVLGPLEKETLRVTLEIFLNENMDIKLAAKKLHIHPNTVNYRLGKIAESLGLDPRIFKQAFELRIALITDQLFASDK